MQISSAAPQLPLFYYHIPRLTGVEVDIFQECVEFSALAGKSHQGGQAV